MMKAVESNHRRCGIKKWVFRIGVIASIFLLLQSFRFPYQNFYSTVPTTFKAPDVGNLENESSPPLFDQKLEVKTKIETNRNGFPNDTEFGHNLWNNDAADDFSFEVPEATEVEDNAGEMDKNDTTKRIGNKDIHLCLTCDDNHLHNITPFEAILPSKTDNLSGSSLFTSTEQNNVLVDLKLGNSTKKKWTLPPATIEEMNLLLVQGHRSLHKKMKLKWSSECDKELLKAKAQVENAPILRSDPELFPPIFRNVSTFKRSYEMMVLTLKVYVYKEGNKPIFHQPHLKGIYASEGWFMKLIEESKHFLVKNPRKAHLFYLPFSSRFLRTFLYIPDTHSRKNMAEHLRNYVHMVASKYPFWNRTRGADHFLVACHDWAPSVTNGPLKKSIRVLCKSDLSDGFRIGEDISLPNTNILLPHYLNSNLGGKPTSQRTILAFYAGNLHGELRLILLKHWKDKDPDMKIFGPLSDRGQKTYINYMKTSKYCICPKGYQVNTPRVVEAIIYECVPVIISDNYVPPFFDILNWESIAVFVLEKDVSRLKDILLSIPEEKYLLMQQNVKKVQKHFLWHKEPVKYDLFHMTLHSIWFNRLNRI